MRHLLCLFAITLPAFSSAADTGAVYQKIAIATDHPAASAAGLEVHRAGGNVIDVAAAVGFALSVLRPESSGLGGGGFMVIWDANEGKSIALDYRERAPAVATADMFLDEQGNLIAELSQTGAKAAAVPHHVAGLCYAVETYGELELKQVLAPAIRLAREGVPLDEHSAEIRRHTLAKFEKRPAWKETFESFYRLYLQNGAPPKAGDVFKSPQRVLLERIAEQGPAGFYDGPSADALLATMQQAGGVIARDDLRGMHPTVRNAITASYNNGTIVTMPPPSSGGVALVETLQMLSAFEKQHPDLADQLHDGDSILFRHVLAEALKHAFADRATYLGDPDYTDVPTSKLVDPEYAAKLAAKIDINQTRPLAEYGRTLPTRDAGTTHFSVIDAEGNAVACTETINLGFGSYVVVPETGLLLNNEMDDFAAKPGVPNAFGLVQSEAAAVGPGRRPLSSMTPTIYVRDGKAVLAVGASGGPRIITATLQVFLNATRFEMPAQAAVDAGRQHHQWLPNTLLLEPALWQRSREALEQRGHVVEREPALGVSQLVVRRRDGLHAASDPRKGGRPAGE